LSSTNNKEKYFFSFCETRRKRREKKKGGGLTVILGSGSDGSGLFCRVQRRAENYLKLNKIILRDYDYFLPGALGKKSHTFT